MERNGHKKGPENPPEGMNAFTCLQRIQRNGWSQVLIEFPRQSAIFGEAKRNAEGRSLPTQLVRHEQNKISPVSGNSVRGTERKRKQISKRRWSCAIAVAMWSEANLNCGVRWCLNFQEAACDGSAGLEIQASRCGKLAVCRRSLSA